MRLVMRIFIISNEINRSLKTTDLPCTTCKTLYSRISLKKEKILEFLRFQKIRFVVLAWNIAWWSVLWKCIRVSINMLEKTRLTKRFVRFKHNSLSSPLHSFVTNRSNWIKPTNTNQSIKNTLRHAQTITPSFAMLNAPTVLSPSLSRKNSQSVTSNQSKHRHSLGAKKCRKKKSRSALGLGSIRTPIDDD